MASEGGPAGGPESYRREGRGLEFDRVSIFTDAGYAIAMTLLVVELQVPEIPEAGGLGAALQAARPQVIGFFIGFAVLGRYWMAHHQFFADLKRVDRGLMGLNLVYLAFVAFAPFPVALISRYEEHPAAFVLFALVMAAISAMEAVMFLYAARRDYFVRPVPPTLLRYGLIGSGAPVAVMLLSIPLAFVSPNLALLSWLVMFPLGIAIDRAAPPEFETLKRRDP
jgi:uncharacterized membrane protein